jgi:hypothetical protein
MAIPNDGKWHLQHHCVLKDGRKGTCWKAAHPKTGKVRTVIRAGLPGGKEHPAKPPKYEAFKGHEHGVGPRPEKIPMKGPPKEAEIREWIESEGMEAVISEMSRGFLQPLSEIAWAEPKVKGAMVYVPHKAWYDWRDGQGDKDAADMKVSKNYLEVMADSVAGRGNARVHPHTYQHPTTGEDHHAVEFRNADHAADFIDKLKRSGLKGEIPWHHVGE